MGRGSLRPWLCLNPNFYPARLETGSGRPSRADRTPNTGGPFHSWPGHGGEEPPPPQDWEPKRKTASQAGGGLLFPHIQLPHQVYPMGDPPWSMFPARGPPSPHSGDPLPIRVQARAARKDDPDHQSNESPDLMSSLRGGGWEGREKRQTFGFWLFFPSFLFSLIFKTIQCRVHLSQ